MLITENFILFLQLIMIWILEIECDSIVGCLGFMAYQPL